MTREEIIRNLEYTMKKHKNDTVNTFETNISAMCKDILDYLEQQPCDDLINQRATTCRHGGHCEWVACDKCNHYESDPLIQQPCEDCISRQSVKRKLQEHHDLFINAYGGRVGFKSMADAKEKARVDEITNCIAMVVNEPSVTPKEKTGWIPVNERLPEDGTYLVTVERMDGETRIDMKSFAKDLNKVDEFNFPKHKCGWYDYDSEYGFWEDTKVIAWMPLPEPHKAESEE